MYGEWLRLKSGSNNDCETGGDLGNCPRYGVLLAPTVSVSAWLASVSVISGMVAMANFANPQTAELHHYRLVAKPKEILVGLPNPDSLAQTQVLVFQLEHEIGAP